MSVGVGRTFEAVCLFVCLFVCPQHNSKTNYYPKVVKLNIGINLGYHRSNMILGLKGQGYRVRVRVRVQQYGWVR